MRNPPPPLLKSGVINAWHFMTIHSFGGEGELTITVIFCYFRWFFIIIISLNQFRHWNLVYILSCHLYFTHSQNPGSKWNFSYFIYRVMKNFQYFIPFNFNVAITLIIQVGVFQAFVFLKLNDEFKFSIENKETLVSPLFDWNLPWPLKWTLIHIFHCSIVHHNPCELPGYFDSTDLLLHKHLIYTTMQNSSFFLKFSINILVHVIYYMLMYFSASNSYIILLLWFH